MTFELFCRINRYERLSPLRLLIKELDSPFQANSGESGSVVRHSHDGVMTVIAILARLSGELGRVRVAAVNAAVLAGNPCPRLPCAGSFAAGCVWILECSCGGPTEGMTSESHRGGGRDTEVSAASL